jgi:hypothetical protein
LAARLWAYQWEQIGPCRPSATKDRTAVAAVDRVLAVDWVSRAKRGKDVAWSLPTVELHE